MLPGNTFKLFIFQRNIMPTLFSMVLFIYEQTTCHETDQKRTTKIKRVKKYIRRVTASVNSVDIQFVDSLKLFKAQTNKCWIRGTETPTMMLHQLQLPGLL